MHLGNSEIKKTGSYSDIVHPLPEKQGRQCQINRAATDLAPVIMAMLIIMLSNGAGEGLRCSQKELMQRASSSHDND